MPRGRNDNGDYIYEGIELRLIEILSKKFNFTTDYREVSAALTLGYVKKIYFTDNYNCIITAAKHWFFYTILENVTRIFSKNGKKHNLCYFSKAINFPAGNILL